MVSGQKVTDGNEIADQLARQGSSHPLTGHGPGLSIIAKVARGLTIRKHRSIGSPCNNKGRLRAVSKNSL